MDVDKLECAIKTLTQYILILRGKEQDWTGLGLWRIACRQLETAMDCKIITQEQWRCILEELDKL